MKCFKSSISRGQRSRSQHYISCAEIRIVINNCTGYGLILLKFRTDFDHVTLNFPQTFNVLLVLVRGQGHSVT